MLLPTPHIFRLLSTKFIVSNETGGGVMIKKKEKGNKKIVKDLLDLVYFLSFFLSLVFFFIAESAIFSLNVLGVKFLFYVGHARWTAYFFYNCRTRRGKKIRRNKTRIITQALSCSALLCSALLLLQLYSWLQPIVAITTCALWIKIGERRGTHRRYRSNCAIINRDTRTPNSG